MEDIGITSSGTTDMLIMFVLLVAAFCLGYLLRYYIGMSREDRLREDLDAGFTGMMKKIERLEQENDDLRMNLQNSQSSMSRSIIDSKDDLKKIEGIGPVIESMLNKEGIFKWNQLKTENVENLKKIIYKGGDNFKIHDPSTWPRQASLADEGKWNELKDWQKKLKGGKIV